MIRWRQNGAPPSLGLPQRQVDCLDDSDDEQTLVSKSTTKNPTLPQTQRAKPTSHRSSASKSRSAVQKSSRTARQVKENLQIASKPLKQEFTRPPRLPLRPRDPASQNSAQHTDPTTCNAPRDCTPGNNSRHTTTQQPGSGVNQPCSKTPTTHPSSFAHQAGRTQTPADSSLSNSVHRGVANSSVDQHKTPSTHPITANIRHERETATPADGHIAPSNGHASERDSVGVPQVERASRVPITGAHFSEKYEMVEFKQGNEVRRYSKLAVLGFGGSSKVRENLHYTLPSSLPPLSIYLLHYHFL